MNIKNIIELVRNLEPDTARNGSEEYLVGYSDGGQVALDDVVDFLEELSVQQTTAQANQDYHYHASANAKFLSHTMSVPRAIEINLG